MVSIGELKSIRSRKGNEIPARQLVLQDEEGKIVFSLWYKFARTPKVQLHSVIGITGVLVNIYKGNVSLSSKHAAFRVYAHLATDTKFHSLLSWFALQSSFERI